MAFWSTRLVFAETNCTYTRECLGLRYNPLSWTGSSSLTNTGYQYAHFLCIGLRIGCAHSPWHIRSQYLRSRTTKV
eukprot:scaffold18261_cov31-Attheya_sp.AAC.1